MTTLRQMTIAVLTSPKWLMQRPLSRRQFNNLTVFNGHVDVRHERLVTANELGNP